MTLPQILVLGGFVLVVFFHSLLIHYGTQFGREGRRQAYIRSMFGIAESVLVFGVTWLFAVTDTANRLGHICMVLLGVGMLVASVINLRALQREKAGGVVKETLSDVRVMPTGYRNRARLIEGLTENGERREFMLRGVDKDIANYIKDCGLKYVTVIYHTANKRIEKIYY